jgi:hypothetical protein
LEKKEFFLIDFLPIPSPVFDLLFILWWKDPLFYERVDIMAKP